MFYNNNLRYLLLLIANRGSEQTFHVNYNVWSWHNSCFPRDTSMYIQDKIKSCLLFSIELTGMKKMIEQSRMES
jgi:hypothetical protein